ncbi:MAG: TatD family deoxyribonuclease [Acidobacteria bacterium]|nr:MAG: TatD family deoxyribonuclease [Acidobacteriota bacterium]
MLIDSHAHLDDARFDSDRDAVLQRAWDVGVRKILTIGNGSGPDQMGCGIPIAEAHEWVYTSVGVHPHDAGKVEERHYQQIEQLASHPKVIALGETGLDYYYDHSPRTVQREVFAHQISFANKLDLPVIVHTRDADEDTEAVLKQETPAHGVIHCFTSGDKLADFALSIGFLISFSGIVTFPNAKSLAEIARRIPADRILLETDCPYLAPVPHRGKRNEPSFVADTARFIATLRGIAPDELAAQTSANFDRVFALKTS